MAVRAQEKSGHSRGTGVECARIVETQKLEYSTVWKLFRILSSSREVEPKYKKIPCMCDPTFKRTMRQTIFMHRGQCQVFVGTFASCSYDAYWWHDTYGLCRRLCASVLGGLFYLRFQQWSHRICSCALKKRTINSIGIPWGIVYQELTQKPSMSY